MLTIRPPTPDAVSAFLGKQTGLPLSYPNEGMTRGPVPVGFSRDLVGLQLGIGTEVFERAVEAVDRWTAHRQGWVRVAPTDAPPRVGLVVAVSARIGPVWATNACRVVDMVDDRGPLRRYGFVYGTLAGHPEQGEARFTVEHRADGGVWWEVLTLTRPGSLLARLGDPVTRRYRRRFALGTGDALRRAIRTPG